MTNDETMAVRLFCYQGQSITPKLMFGYLYGDQLHLANGT